MTSPNRAHRVFQAAVVIVFTATIASAQSLGDVARQEEARRKAITSSGKVYTNESVRPDPRAPEAVVPPEAAPASEPAAEPSRSGVAPEATEPAPAPSTPADSKNDEATWRQRLQAERDALGRAQLFADALQSRINGLTADFTARDDPAQRGVIAGDRQKALAELDRVKQEIQQHTKAIADIQEEARRAGVPAGWVR